MAESTVCQPLRRDMLPEPVDIDAPGVRTLSAATELARAKAQELHPEVMPLAWFDQQTGGFSPQVTCCSDEKPAWLVYALSRGANLFISINREQFVFAYKKL